MTDLAGNVYQSQDMPVWIGLTETFDQDSEKTAVEIDHQENKMVKKRNDTYVSGMQTKEETNKGILLLGTGIMTLLMTIGGCVVSALFGKK